jgi:hypothetical protein
VRLEGVHPLAHLPLLPCYRAPIPQRPFVSPRLLQGAQRFLTFPSQFRRGDAVVFKIPQLERCIPSGDERSLRCYGAYRDSGKVVSPQRSFPGGG